MGYGVFERFANLNNSHVEINTAPTEREDFAQTHS
jgi:hypothetical protein